MIQSPQYLGVIMSKIDWGEVFGYLIVFTFVFPVIPILIWAGAVQVNKQITYCDNETIPYTTTTKSEESTTPKVDSVIQGRTGIKNVCKKNDKVVSETVLTSARGETITTYEYKPVEVKRYFAPAPTNTASCPITTCNDGSCSSSTGRGTCSWHGGIAY